MSRSRVDLEAWLVGLAAAAVVLLYALRNGTYDVVARGELGVLIWAALGVGWLSGVLPRARLPRVTWIVVAGFTALAIWTAICLQWSISDEKTVVELGRVVHHAGVFLLAASLLTRRTCVAAVAGLTVGVVVVAWLGLCNWIWPDSVALDHARLVLSVRRLSYPLDYWNGMATLGSMGIVVCLAWATHAQSAWWRAAAAAPIPGIALCTYLTYSRGGAFELAIGLLALLALSRYRFVLLLLGVALAGVSALAILVLRDHQPLVQGVGSDGAGAVMALVIGGGVVCAGLAALLKIAGADERLRLPVKASRVALTVGGVVVVVVAAIAGPNVYDRAKHSYESAQTNSTQNPTARFTNLGGYRKQQFSVAEDTWKAHRGEGTGPGTFEFDWAASPYGGVFVRDVHNIYLEALAESGVLGLLALLLTLGGAVAVAVMGVVRSTTPAERGATAGVGAILAVFLFAAGIDWMWELTALPTIMLIGLGAVAASLSGERTAPSGWRPRASRAAAAVVALVAVLVILPPVVSTSEIRSSQASARANDPATALRQADDAIDSAPWSASAMAQKALLLETANRLDAAQGYATLAARREPDNWRYALLEARLSARRGDTKTAIADYQRAKRLSPGNPALP